MRVISKRTLRRFWERPRTLKGVQASLVAWYKIVLHADWRSFADLRRTFNSADAVGDCVVFNVGGNKCRVIGRIRYSRNAIPGVVYVLKVMTHSEYNENAWPDECGCHTSPPRRPTKRG